jgi:hypothetical protein
MRWSLLDSKAVGLKLSQRHARTKRGDEGPAGRRPALSQRMAFLLELRCAKVSVHPSHGQ